MRQKMLDAIADKPLLSDQLPTVSPVKEVDRYLQSKSAAVPVAMNSKKKKRHGIILLVWLRFGQHREKN